MQARHTTIRTVFLSLLPLALRFWGYSHWLAAAKTNYSRLRTSATLELSLALSVALLFLPGFRCFYII